MDNTLSINNNNNKIRRYTFEELNQMSKIVAESNFLGTNKPSEIFTLFMLAEAEGKNPVQACMDYHIIQGKPALNSQAILTRFQKLGGKIKYIKRDDNECIIEFSHEQAGSLRIEWNIERAKQAGLDISKANWKRYPRQMLSARCISEGVRALYPACLDGLYTVEEVQDFDKSFGDSTNNVVDVSIDNSVYDEKTDTYLADEKYIIVPSGKSKGKKWSDLDIETLCEAELYYSEKKDQKSKKYYEIINKIIEIKRGKNTITVSEDEDVYKNDDGKYFDENNFTVKGDFSDEEVPFK